MTVATLAARRRKSTRLNTSGIGGVGQAALRATSAMVLLILLGPMIVLVIMSFSGADYVVFPPGGFGLKWYYKFFTSPDFMFAFLTSIQVAIAASAGATLLGIPAAYVLVRRRFPGKGMLEGIFLAPLMVPQIIVGAGLLQLYEFP